LQPGVVESKAQSKLREREAASIHPFLTPQHGRGKKLAFENCKMMMIMVVRRKNG
jgi:hypothetical protein